MSRNGYYAVGLDVGTTKICAICGKLEDERINIVSVGSCPSFGLRKGIVADMDMTADSVKMALRRIEKGTGEAVRAVVVGIAGGHIKGFTGYGAIGIKGGLIRQDDVDRLVDSAGAVCVPVDREILHMIPSGFRVDGGNGIKDPVGLCGERLEADVHIVTGSVTSVRNLVRCCEMAQVQVRDIVLEPLASADAVLRTDERERGVALVDIGGGTTDIAVYREGMLKHTAVLALGGNHITNDISVGLGIPAGEAERIKKLHGYSMAGMVGEGCYIDINREGGKIEKIPLEHLAAIIEPRCEELMLLVKKEVDIAAKEGFTGKEMSSRFSGVVLTGGTALLKGIDSVAKLVLRLPVRLGTPMGVSNEDLVNSPEYATGVGLLRYGLEHQKRRDEWCCEPLTTGRIFERMKYWVKGHFQ
jgi:cell division protein FtsA